MLEEFKKFALRGNVVDLAVGVIIGAAFGKIVDSLVTDLIMPMIGAVTGGLDFSNYFVPLSKAVHSEMAYDEAKKFGAGFFSFSNCLMTRNSTKAMIRKLIVIVRKLPQANTAPCFFASARLPAVTAFDSPVK